MNKKPQLRYKDSTRSWNKNSYVSPFSHPDPIEEERVAQLQEHRKKQKREVEPFPKKKHKLPDKSPKSRVMNFEENLERTWKWLAETFPVHFGAKSVMRPLDTHIIRDIKDHYKRCQVQNRYPKDLIIKAALARYMEQPEYLRCLQECSYKYNIHGTAIETVTKSEQEKALQRLKQMP